MKPLENLLVGLGRLIAGHHDYKMLPKMVTREVMVRDVYDWAFFESRDPAHIKYHETRPRGNIMKAQSNTDQNRGNFGHQLQRLLGKNCICFLYFKK